jgi:hypothetical protein
VDRIIDIYYVIADFVVDHLRIVLGAAAALVVIVVLAVVLGSSSTSSTSTPTTAAASSAANSTSPACESAVAALENFVHSYPSSAGPLSQANTAKLNTLEHAVVTTCPLATTRKVASNTVKPWLSSLGS